jgi:hypothetical protein
MGPAAMVPLLVASTGSGLAIAVVNAERVDVAFSRDFSIQRNCPVISKGDRYALCRLLLPLRSVVGVLCDRDLSGLVSS